MNDKVGGGDDEEDNHGEAEAGIMLLLIFTMTKRSSFIFQILNLPSFSFTI